MTFNQPSTVTTRNHRRAIGTFPNRHAAEQALHELRDSGFSMDRVSVVAQDSKRSDTIAGAGISDRASAHDHADNKADDGVKVGALSGGALGGLTGLLVGIGALAIPGVGPIMLAGAAATALATTVAGGAIGAAAGSLLGGLIGMGIPEERARVYNDRVSAGEYLVMVDGSDAEISHAEAILNHRGIQEWGVYDIPAGAVNSGSVTNAVVDQPAITNAEAVRQFDDRRIVDHEENRTPSSVMPASTTPVTMPNQAVNQSIATNAEDIKLYEERLAADKTREKTGEVAIGKRVETETVQTSVPIERERIVVERVSANDVTAVPVGADAFQDGEAIRVEVYEETPDIHKEAFVREEVNLRKEVAQETVNVEEILRREELNVDTQGHPTVNTRPDSAVDERL